MNDSIVTTKTLNPANGIVALSAILAGFVLTIILFIGGVFFLQKESYPLGIPCMIAWVVLFLICCICPAGLKAVRPNEALVLTLFGNYYGTITHAGFFFVNPFCVCINPTYERARTTASEKVNAASFEGRVSVVTLPRKSISLKTNTWSNGTQKVNDLLGNPIIIGAVVMWKVVDPTRAVFEVEHYANYLSTQTDSTIRNIARLYPYDNMSAEEDGQQTEQTLRGSSIEIAQRMQAELQVKVAQAGLFIEEVRISHLSYAEEIASAMLQRQQATAIIAARQKLVDGAVGMVKLAIDKLGEDQVVVLDEERKAAMVSNLLVVLCANRDAQPIVNSGSIY